MKLIEKLAYDLANGPAPDEVSFQLMQLAYKEGFRKAREMARYKVRLLLPPVADELTMLTELGEEEVK
jgi:hypothetical protein